MKTCNFCNSTELTVLFNLPRRNILKCGSCRMVFADNINSGLGRKYYDEDYSKKILSDFRLDMPHSDYARNMLKKIALFKNPGRILDIGCGPGFFLAQAKKQGWEDFGVELTERNYKHAKSVLGLNVYNADISSLNFQESSFDVVTMWDVIEHIDNPGNVIRKVYMLLKDDGLFCLETPNFSSLYRYLTGKRWISFSEISHILFFNLKTLEKILKENGFRTIFSETSNLNLFSQEGLRRLRLYDPVYNFKLMFEKITRNSGSQTVNKTADQKQHRFWISKFSKLINMPANVLLNRFFLGDQLRVFAVKDNTK